MERSGWMEDISPVCHPSMAQPEVDLEWEAMGRLGGMRLRMERMRRDGYGGMGATGRGGGMRLGG